MKNVLFVNACVRENSRTRILAEKLLSALQGEVYEANLEQMDLRPFTKSMLDQRDELLAAKAYTDPMFENARRFVGADVIVFAAPYWDCSFPSSVKVYIEHIMVNGITFTYTEDGYPKGMCKAKKLYYVSTAGGPVIGTNHGFEYVKALAALYWGIPETKLFQAENLDIIRANVGRILEEAMAEISESVKE